MHVFIDFWKLETENRQIEFWKQKIRGKNSYQTYPKNLWVIPGNVAHCSKFVIHFF